jgi:hypothetical protein
VVDYQDNGLFNVQAISLNKFSRIVTKKAELLLLVLFARLGKTCPAALLRSKHVSLLLGSSLSLDI